MLAGAGMKFLQATNGQSWKQQPLDLDGKIGSGLAANVP
jgi:hypothetical protein